MWPQDTLGKSGAIHSDLYVTCLGEGICRFSETQAGGRTFLELRQMSVMITIDILAKEIEIGLLFYVWSHRILKCRKVKMFLAPQKGRVFEQSLKAEVH